MKILSLRFKNLNSLTGEWSIDFTSPQYVSEGIFAIVGPTGAGKSTILDAICLALYGQTPRLGKITKSSNEIMSRQKGECFSEVTFESQQGRFRCYWSQHKARKSPEGKLADPKHEISKADTGEILESMRSKVQGVIESKTGMDFERFTRSIMLAQGDFDSFLKADSGKKADILEQITGTAIYSQISIVIHEKQKEEDQKRELLQSQTDHLPSLTEEELASLKAEEAQASKEATQSSKTLDQLTRALLWREKINSLETELIQLREKKSEWTKRSELFKAERERLEQSRKCAQLDGDYASLQALRESQKRDLSLKETEEKSLPALEQRLVLLKEKHGLSEKAVQKAQKNQEAQLPQIRKTLSLDQDLRSLRASLKEIEAERVSGENERLSLVQKRESIQKEKSTLTRDKALFAQYLEDHRGDNILISHLAGWQEKKDQVTFLSGERAQKKAQLLLSQGKLAQLRTEQERQAKSQERIKQELNATGLQIKNKRDIWETTLGGRTLGEYRRERDSLHREKSLLSKIASLEEERTHLQDGKPCPLCGALEHPYAQGNTPKQDGVDKRILELSQLFDKGDAYEEDARLLKRQEEQIQRQMGESETSLVKIQGEIKHVQSEAEALQEGQKVFFERTELIERDLKSSIEPLGMDISEDWDTLFEKLKERKERWISYTERLGAQEQQEKELSREEERLSSLLESLAKGISQRALLYEKQRTSLSDKDRERREILGERDPQVEETHLSQQIELSFAVERESRGHFETSKTERDEKSVRVKSLAEQVAKREPLLLKAEADFLKSLSILELQGEESFLALRLTERERQELSKQDELLKAEQSDLGTRFKDRTTQLGLEREKNLTLLNREDLITQKAEAEVKTQSIHQNLGALKQRLEENDKAQALLKENFAALEKQRAECLRWDKIHGLIGSSDGKKYRNFAQGITFELMVAHANRQLTKMTDRYLLERCEEKPLELNVMDNYQAGEIRSTKNLSGGEGFILSLALALGLSQMASKRVRVDSLFLDEGFGTLDDEALETALDTLSGLHSEGKMIGLISHVPALKERIPTQIRVTPLSGGESRLSGPGCSFH